jgi:hypothetical protein
VTVLVRSGPLYSEDLAGFTGYKSGNKPDAGARGDIAVIDAGKSAAVPEKVHLADEHPATAQNLLHMRDVPNAERSFHPWFKDHR